MTRPVARCPSASSRLEPRLVALVLLLAAAAGCGGSSDSGPGGPRTIRVTRVWRQALENGTTATYVPNDVVGLSVVGATTTTSGGPSTWTVSAVPAGEYLLRVDWSDGGVWFVRTGADALDLSVEQGGYAAVLPNLPTSLTLNAQGLDPWQVANDSIQTVSWDGFVYNYLYPTVPLDGDVAFAETFDWLMALLSPGDRLLLAQFRYSPIIGSADWYEHAVALAAVTGITMVDGGTTSVPATLAATTDNASLSVTWQASSFETGAQPASPTFSDLYVFAAPAAAQEPTHYMSPDYLHIPVAVPASDRAISALPYSAFVSGFSQYLFAGYVGFVSRTAPGATVARRFFPGNASWSGMPASQLGARVSPPRTVEIQGLDALAPQTGVGLTPTISWSAPQVGSTSRYRVVLQRIYASGTLTRAETVATFYTRGTSVAVPSGLLAAGQSYLADVEAYAGAYDESTPLAEGIAFGKASVVTETFSP